MNQKNINICNAKICEFLNYVINLINNNEINQMNCKQINEYNLILLDLLLKPNKLLQTLNNNYIYFNFEFKKQVIICI